ncbi:isoprenylcysteine carboxylmethyltransferase family protein [Thalassomonas viridans]|uniref:Isoprenylcysteine carboxylmethyltransferase family protein n=1 Tax=Thalassomonas viridans TaxID=137584 RepID=A0AAE9Z9E3_9GAMM|nr:isoprenylcysteine carboxylmethyltransferase family protein [Thalassomonas viridans]WDE07733.1 isoprenylcysteine carboxylmethyltransferase family protein [Thalassomonas viridans]
MSKLELKIPPVLLVLIFALLMWSVASWQPQAFLSAPYSLILALIAVISGALVALAGVLSFKRVSTTVNPMSPGQASSLVIRGIYHYTRNPMYLGFALALLGWGFYLANFYSLLLLLPFIAYMSRFQIRPEEAALEANFGEAFVRYKSQVRRWL